LGLNQEENINSVISSAPVRTPKDRWDRFQHPIRTAQICREPPKAPVRLWKGSVVYSQTNRLYSTNSENSTRRFWFLAADSTRLITS
jgi:hypothetical protein